MTTYLTQLAWRLGVIAIPVIALGLLGMAAYTTSRNLTARIIRRHYSRGNQ